MSDYQDYTFNSSSPSHTNEYITNKLLKLLDNNKHKCILDVGCGNGWLSRILIEKGFNVYGIDASPTGIEIANEFHKGRFFMNDISTGELPEPLKFISFDTVISTEVIEHLYSPQKYIEFCKKIIENSEGEIFITTPYHGLLKNILLALSNKMDAHFTVSWEGGHIKFFSRKTLSKF